MFKKIAKLWTRKVATVALVVALLGMLVYQSIPGVIQQATTGLHDVLTLGTVQAAGVADATADGAADDVQAQALLTALPATGGRLYILTGVYVWTNATTITDASPGITISGTGIGTSITGSGATSPITAGGNNWVLENLKVSVNTATLLAAMGATTGWEWRNVTTSDGYYAYRTDDLTTGASWNIPTGRTATYVIAASDAPAHVKAQADVVCDGTGDQSEINTAIIAASTVGGTVQLSAGRFTINAPIVPKDDVWLKGSSGGILSMENSTSVIYVANGSDCDGIAAGASVTGWIASDLTLNGNKANNASGSGVSVAYIKGQWRNIGVNNFNDNGWNLVGTGGGGRVTGYMCQNVQGYLNGGHGFYAKDWDAAGMVDTAVFDINTGSGLYLDTVVGLEFNGLDIGGNTGLGIYAKGNTLHFWNIHTEVNAGGAAHFKNVSYTSVANFLSASDGVDANGRIFSIYADGGGTYSVNGVITNLVINCPTASVKALYLYALRGWTITGGSINLDGANTQVLDSTSADYAYPFPLVNVNGYANPNTYRQPLLVTTMVVKAFDSDLFNAAATTDKVNIWTQPANTVLVGMKFVLSTKFVAVGMTDVDITVGSDSSGATYVLNTVGNLTSDALQTAYTTRGAMWKGVVGDAGDGTFGAFTSWRGAAITWQAYSTAVGANLSTLSAGKVVFYFQYIDLN